MMWISILWKCSVFSWVFSVNFILAANGRRIPTLIGELKWIFWSPLGLAGCDCLLTSQCSLTRTWRLRAFFFSFFLVLARLRAVFISKTARNFANKRLTAGSCALVNDEWIGLACLLNDVEFHLVEVFSLLMNFFQSTSFLRQTVDGFRL